MTDTFTDVPPTGQPIRGEVFFARSRPVMSVMKRTWWIFLVQGIVAVALGLAAIMWPDAAATVLMTFLGVNLVLLGVIATAMAIRIKRTGPALR